MDFILYEVDGAVATITINRPKALNALNSQVLEELDATLDAVDLNTVRCIILTGAGDIPYAVLINCYAYRKWGLPSTHCLRSGSGKFTYISGGIIGISPVNLFEGNHTVFNQR